MRSGLGLLAICALGALARCVGLEKSAGPLDETVLGLGDAQYHARLALYTFHHFPDFLTWDSYLGHPQGAAVPWPPLQEWLLAGWALLSGTDEAGFDRTIAFVPPLLGGLTAAGVYAAARSLGGVALALSAAGIYSVLGIGVLFSDFGNVDHHALQALLGAFWMATVLALLKADPTRSRLVVLTLALTCVRTGVLLGWPGSLLYLALFDGGLFSAGVLAARRDLLVVLATSVAATIGLVLPVLLQWDEPTGGWFSAVALSGLHLSALGGLAILAAALAGLEGLRPAGSAAGRTGRAVGLAGATACAALLIPALREGLLGGLQFVAMQDAGGARTLEQMPLIPLGGRPVMISPFLAFGFFAPLLPLAPVFALARVRSVETRLPSLALAAWTLALTALAIGQLRYGHDLGPAAAVSFALGGAALLGRLGDGLGIGAAGRRVLGAVLVLGMLSPCLSTLFARGQNTFRWLRAPAPAEDPWLETSHGSLQRFARRVRESTPETSGFLDPSATPEYGVIVPPSLGHAIQYVSRRAVPADNFLERPSPETYHPAVRFFETLDEAEAVRIAEQLDARFVVTWRYPTRKPNTIAARLQRDDGAARGGRAALGHFRLIAEGPFGGRAFADFMGFDSDGGATPYKLFEVVPGATLDVSGISPETRVSASAWIEGASGRRFQYRAVARTDSTGRARLRVPYATDTLSPARAKDAWVVRAGTDTRDVTVPDAAIRAGESILVDMTEARG